jgi:hypothetical protein
MKCFARSIARLSSWMHCQWIPGTDRPSEPQIAEQIIIVMGQQNPPSGGSRKISFNVSDQYEIQDVIGEGAYGVVW